MIPPCVRSRAPPDWLVVPAGHLLAVDQRIEAGRIVEGEIGTKAILFRAALPQVAHGER
jgi:hypothetical protein